MKKRYVLGISAYYHDSAVALLADGVIVAAAHEERFTRKKHDPDFPHQAILYVLEEEAINITDVEAIVFYDKPFLKFERLLETYHAFAPKGMISFLTSIPVWIKEKIFMRSVIAKEITKIAEKQNCATTTLPTLYFSEHHLSHSASAFYPSPFEESAILTLDGVGEWATTSIAYGKDAEIKVLNEIHFPHSLGLLYTAFTAYCGFKVNSGEYKLMGLAPYGNYNSPETQDFAKKIREVLIDVKEDGSYALNMEYFAYATGLRMYDEKLWTKLFGIPPRVSEAEDISQSYMNMALAIQIVTEEIVLKLAHTAKKLTNSNNLCLSGGVALNCVANGKLLREKIFDNIWIQPASGDAGGALGAALAWWYSQGNERVVDKNDSMAGSYLGPKFTTDQVLHVCKKFNAPYAIIDDEQELANTVANLIGEGNVIGWFQGRMEYGPRALGNRSILGDPRNPEMQKKLNLKIKYREGFRPFAPSVLEEKVSDFFEIDTISPYMLLVANVKEELCNPLSAEYAELPMWDRLYFQRSSMPAITHVDYSARIQSVSKRTNPRYWNLINAFDEKFKTPVIVNTSFNVRGEPIVCTPQDAYVCFMRTEMDYLVLGNVLLEKVKQPALAQDSDWQKTYELD